MTAIVVLGMHRSGTSCLAGMLAAGGAASAGAAVRNWDNARGHHEMLDVIRLDEAVLAHSGGHWLAPPPAVRWTDEHAATRDRILRTSIDGCPPLLKDPRMLLVLPFWRASAVPMRVVGIVRHPLAVARSLEAWRGMSLAEGLALWCAHNRALAEDRERHDDPLVDFDAPKAAVVAQVAAAFALDEAMLAAAYDEALVHHDHGDADGVPELDEALALHRQLVGAPSPAVRRAFPRDFAQELNAGNFAAALPRVHAAIAAIPDGAAILVPVVTALLRHAAFAEARALIAEHAARIEAALAELLHGKIALAAGEADAAVRHLTAACAVPQPLFQARSLLPQALRAAGRRDDARAALLDVARTSLYPHVSLATLAEWSWLDGAPHDALAEMARAIAAAPLYRRGRLRSRRAEWLAAEGDPATARAELELALVEDPGYVRSRELLARYSQ